MIRRISQGALAALLGWAAIAADGADTAAAPLESTKQELRQLQKEQKTTASPAVTDGVKVDSSAFQLAPQGGDTPQQWLADKLQQEKKREQQRERRSKNWLVDGVQKLERADGTVRADRPDEDQTAAASGERLLVDRDDPQYLLSLFEEQKQAHDSKGPPDKGARARTADPFAPFLQGWLGNSPVRGQFFDEFAKGSTGSRPEAASSPVAGGGESAGLPTVTPLGPRESPAPAAAKANPYLAELNAPLPAAVPAPENPAPNSSLPALLPASPGGATIPTPGAPLPDSRPPSKGPPPGPADEQKYFPQLKKF